VLIKISSIKKVVQTLGLGHFFKTEILNIVLQSIRQITAARNLMKIDENQILVKHKACQKRYKKMLNKLTKLNKNKMNFPTRIFLSLFKKKFFHIPECGKVELEEKLL